MSEDLKERLNKGWRIARENFDDKVYFYAPSIKRYQTERFSNSSLYFVPISITGSDCQLQCDHCKAKILKSMYEAKTQDKLFDLASNLYKKGTRGILISGGSNKNGQVPLVDFLPTIKKIKQSFNFFVIVHTGLVDRILAEGLKEAQVDAAMIDIIGSQKTIQKVYHLGATVDDFARSLELLCEANIKTAPHVVIGLDYGRIDGEYKALEIISKYPISSLVLVGLLPQDQTPMQNVKTPAAQDFAEIFLFARKLFSKVPILLGCERPYGKEKEKIEEFALLAGLNGIAYPSEDIIDFAYKLNLKPIFSQFCCSLIFNDI